MSDNHGNTPAAWTAVTVVLISFIVAGIGLMMENWTVAIVGAVFTPIGMLAGLILSKMGHGATH